MKVLQRVYLRCFILSILLETRLDFADDIKANHVRVVDDEAVVDATSGWPCDSLNAAESVGLPDALQPLIDVVKKGRVIVLHSLLYMPSSFRW